MKFNYNNVIFIAYYGIIFYRDLLKVIIWKLSNSSGLVLLNLRTGKQSQSS